MLYHISDYNSIVITYYNQLITGEEMHTHTTTITTT